MADASWKSIDRRLGHGALACYVLGPALSIAIGIFALESFRSSLWLVLTGGGIGVSFGAGFILLLVQHVRRSRRAPK